MAYKITIHDAARRPWGIETLVTVNDNEDGQIYNWAICTDETPSKATLEQLATERTEKQKQILADKAAAEETREILQDDIASLEEQKATLEAEIAAFEDEKSALEGDSK
jgi:chromosome segregation ATPase